MEASIFSLRVPVYPTSKCHSVKHRSKSGLNLISRNRSLNQSTRNRGFTAIISAVDELSAVTSDPAQVEVSWEILVGAFAGVTPFVVAGIEFSKRIVAQRKCGVCGGSGLVRREKYYFRCPSCGGFLPWQSWKRFFSG
ncbi:hypothetical protein LguiB_003165 [Lonicera macranthoides]